MREGLEEPVSGDLAREGKKKTTINSTMLSSNDSSTVLTWSFPCSSLLKSCSLLSAKSLSKKGGRADERGRSEAGTSRQKRRVEIKLTRRSLNLSRPVNPPLRQFPLSINESSLQIEHRSRFRSVGVGLEESVVAGKKTSELNESD